MEPSSNTYAPSCSKLAQEVVGPLLRKCGHAKQRRLLDLPAIPPTFTPAQKRSDARQFLLGEALSPASRSTSTSSATARSSISRPANSAARTSCRSGSARSTAPAAPNTGSRSRTPRLRRCGARQRKSGVRSGAGKTRILCGSSRDGKRKPLAARLQLQRRGMGLPARR